MPPVRSATHLAWGRAIRQLRTEANYSQDRLALAANVNRQFLGGIERGEDNPSLATITKLAETIGVRVSDMALLAEALLDE